MITKDQNEALQQCSRKAAEEILSALADFAACKRNDEPGELEIASIIYKNMRNGREL